MRTAQDVQKDIYNYGTQTLEQFKKFIENTRMSKTNKFFLNMNLELMINELLNIAFNNKYAHNYLDKTNIDNGILPENYITPKD